MDHYAVVGNPIAHSKSPIIHGLFAKECRQNLDYTRIEAPLDGFEFTVKHFFGLLDSAQSQSPSLLGKGLNVTVPFKEQAWRLSDSLSERARLAGAVNTLFLNENKQICGDNTDGIGLVTDLKNHQVSLHGKKILVIGAGGAVRGVLQPILNELPERIVLTNRTIEKAENLVGLFSALGNIQCVSMERISESFDVIINGTSASLGGELPDISSDIFGSETVVYDMMYGKQDTAFNAWAKQQGAKHVLDGLGMLVEQAAEAFYIWRGIRPKTQSVIEYVRSL